MKIVIYYLRKYIAFSIAKLKERCNAAVIGIVAYFPGSRVEERTQNLTPKPGTMRWSPQAFLSATSRFMR